VPVCFCALERPTAAGFARVRCQPRSGELVAVFTWPTTTFCMLHALFSFPSTVDGAARRTGGARTSSGTIGQFAARELAQSSHAASGLLLGPDRNALNPQELPLFISRATLSAASRFTGDSVNALLRAAAWCLELPQVFGSFVSELLGRAGVRFSVSLRVFTPRSSCAVDCQALALMRRRRAARPNGISTSLAMASLPSAELRRPGNQLGLD